MAGATIKHSSIETNLVALLWIALRGRPCRPIFSNQRLRALDNERAVYADGIVVCGRPVQHPDDDDAVTNPVGVFEVLSKSTEAFDRGDKFAWYRTFPTVRSVVLIAQKSVRVERYRRDDQGVRSLTDLGADGTLELPEIGVSLALAELYENTEAGEAVG